MKLSNVNPKDIIFSLDIGTRSVIGTVGIVKEKKFYILQEFYIEHEERAMVDGQIHDINLVANAVQFVKKELEKALQFPLSNVAIAAAGRFLRTTEVKVELELEKDKEIDKETVRSLELTAVKKAEEEVNKAAEGKLYCVGYSVKNYYLNGYVITNLLAHKGEHIAAEVIGTFLPRSVVESLYAVMNKVGLDVVSLTLEPIAAMEAAIPKSLRLLNLALVDIGAGTSDIAISNKESISAYGMVPLAGDEVTEVIAQTYLTDFNTAEKIKKACTAGEFVKYIDVLGLENEIPGAEVIKLVTPIVDKIAQEIAGRIIELNGGKSPNAVFLVGGGAHTPTLKEALSQKLNLQPQRIAIKGRDAVTDCVCLNNELGSIGVTVLGIALVSIKKLGHDFIDITLNDSVISLFNSHKHTVMDVMVQAGINPKVLMGKNGKNVHFILNSIKRVAFGSLAVNAEIKINGKYATIDSEVKEADKIEVIYAKDGRDAAPKVIDFVQNFNSISFFLEDKIINMDPISTINEKVAAIEERIKEEDIVTIVYPSTLGDFKKYFNMEEGSFNYYLRHKLIDDDYVIQEGDRIYRDRAEVNSMDKEMNEIAANKEVQNESAEANVQEEVAFTKEESLKSTEIQKLHTDKLEIDVLINDKPVKLTGKKNYIFVDVFDYIEFDLTRVKGTLNMKLNGKSVSYYDSLCSGDSIEVLWV